MPGSIEDLIKLLDRLERYEMDEKHLIATLSISELFEYLSLFYENEAEEMLDSGWDDDDEQLPISLGEIEAIYGHIAAQDHSLSNEFEGRTSTDYMMQPANVVDLTILLDKLAEHYYSEELILFENGQDLP